VSTAFLRRLALALGALVVVWLGLKLVRRSGRDQPQAFVRPKIDSSAADLVLIERQTDTIRLTRQGTGWTVNGFPAGPTLVSQLFEAMADTMARGELLAESKSSHERMGLDSLQLRRLVVRKGDETLYTLLIGKRGGNWESAYVRLPNQDAVYQLRGRLVEYVERRVEDWRDKRIVHVEPDSISGVEIQRGKQSYALTKKGSAWTFANGTETDSAAVASLLGQFRTLDASSFATPAQADSTDFSKPERRVGLTGPGGRPIATLAFDSTSGGFWIKRDTLATVYRIDSWLADQLTPIDSTLSKKAAAK